MSCPSFVKSLWHTLALYGAVAVFSYFWNCGLDPKHWYMVFLGAFLFGGSWFAIHKLSRVKVSIHFPSEVQS